MADSGGTDPPRFVIPDIEVNAENRSWGMPGISGNAS
jgi:hypothetical protein